MSDAYRPFYSLIRVISYDRLVSGDIRLRESVADHSHGNHRRPIQTQSCLADQLLHLDRRRLHVVNQLLHPQLGSAIRRSVLVGGGLCDQRSVQELRVGEGVGAEAHQRVVSLEGHPIRGLLTDSVAWLLDSCTGSVLLYRIEVLSAPIVPHGVCIQQHVPAVLLLRGHSSLEGAAQPGVSR